MHEIGRRRLAADRKSRRIDIMGIRHPHAAARAFISAINCDLPYASANASAATFDDGKSRNCKRSRTV